MSFAPFLPKPSSHTIHRIYFQERTSPIQVLHHVLKNVLRISTDERVSFSKWMQYSGYANIQEICEGLPCRLKDLLRYSDYIVNGQHYALKSSTLNTILLFISWMSTRTNWNIISTFFSIFSFTYISRI